MRAHGQRNPSSDERDAPRRSVPPSTPVQRLLNLHQAAGNAAVARAVEARRHRHGSGCGHAEPTVQRRESAQHDHDHDHENRHDHENENGHGHDHGREGLGDTRPASQLSLLGAALATPGSPLPDPFLHRAKAFYRNDHLGAGRVHDNPAAQRATAALGAHAVTVGSHILLGRGAVGSTEILAHEASHLDKNLRGIRETGHDNGAGVSVTDPGQGSERAATADGAAFAAGHGTAPSLARGAATEEKEGNGTVGNGTAPGVPAVQRTLWEFEPGGTFTDAVDARETRWRNRDDPRDIRTSAQVGVPAGTTPRHTDVYDDATGRLYSSANAAFSKKGTIPEREYPERESMARRELVTAKRYIASALTLLKSAGDNPAGALLTGLHSGFPALRAMTPRQIATFLPHVTEVVRRIQAGLDAQGAQIALAGAGTGAPSDAMGWVDLPLKEKLMSPSQKTEELPPMDTARSGPIHLTKGGQIAWYFIHEATHRFAGTLDYQYSPRDAELTQDTIAENLAQDFPEASAEQERTNLGKRALRDPEQYSGANDGVDRQPNWYAMGRRALMNADSYAQFVMVANGAPAPRF
ncbi:DUF4157 domain-containing protein [Streptomyces sp. NPDC102278]|uniref:eCIS core domain-containing protein n=1 Tax=Streptomyces sp. NPDC102278 TaxID=3366152 RepID=UPI00381518EF